MTERVHMIKQRKTFEIFVEKQDAVLQDYTNIFFHGDKKRGMDLHLFFSPYRIPADLTEEEANICANLYSLRKAQIDRRLKKNKQLGILAKVSHLQKTISSLELPGELSPRRKMTRKRFQIGIMKFLAQVHT